MSFDTYDHSRQRESDAKHKEGRNGRRQAGKQAKRLEGKVADRDGVINTWLVYHMGYELLFTRECTMRASNFESSVEK